MSGTGESVHLGPECRICPLCQAIALLRQVRPDTVEQLATALTELVTTLRLLAAGLLPDVAAAAAGAPARASADPAPDPAPDSVPDPASDPVPEPASDRASASAVEPDEHADCGPQDAEAFGAAGSARRARVEHVMQWIDITD